MECMKMAMLKHEETFRQQVDELPRLYRVQKVLMNDVKEAEHHRSNRERSNTEESDLELTLASGSRQRKKKETSFTCDSGTSLSSSAESRGVKSNNHEWRLHNVEEQMREDRVKSSPWLFRCLSLNMT